MRPHFTTPCKRCGQPKDSHAPECSYARMYPPIEQRFWTRVIKGTGDACWEWQGSQDGHGYGSVFYQGRMQKAPRVAWQLTHGAIPAKTEVCHECDNPLCVRPDHLFLGNHMTNAQDMAAKGRQVFQRRPERAKRGEAHYCAKLDNSSIIAIRYRHKNGEPMEQIARSYDVSKQTIWRIIRRLTWKHIE